MSNFQTDLLCKCFYKQRHTEENTVGLIRFWSKYDLLHHIEQVVGHALSVRKRSINKKRHKFSLVSVCEQPTGGDTKKPSVLFQRRTDPEMNSLIKNWLSAGCLEHRDKLSKKEANITSCCLIKQRSKSESDLLRNKRTFATKAKHHSCCENFYVRSLVRKFESFSI